MGVTCQILLANNTKGVYRAGQTLHGSVKYVIDKPTEFRSVTLSLRGKGLCWWAPVFSYIHTIYTGSEDYVNQCMDLLQANGIVTLSAGIYERNFCFVLPEVVPSTYKDFRCFIAYFVELKFVKPDLMSLTKRFAIDIKVQGAIKPSSVHPAIYETKKDFFPSKKSVTLSAQVENMFLYAGETIKLKYNIDDNQSDVNVTGTKIDLVEYITYKSNCNHEKKKSKTVSAVDFKVLGIGNMSPDCNKMINISTSTTPELFSIHSNIFTREYRVRIVVKFGFPHKDLCIEIPVAIGQKMEHSAEGQLDDQPPSYWQVMNEKKD